MPAESPDKLQLFPLPRFSVWRGLVWVSLSLFVFNFWAIGLHHWPAALDFEVPSRSALSQGHWWTLLTYALTGAGTGEAAQWLTGPLSLLFLILAAQLTEDELARRDFLLLTVVCAISGAAFWLPLHWSGDDSLRAGCTVLVLGLGSFLCFVVPDEPMTPRLFLALEVRPQAFFWLVLAVETGAFLGFELPQALGHPGVFQGDFYYSAQLGAMLAGWACARYLLRADAGDDFAPLPQPRVARPPAVPVAAARAAEQDTVEKSAPANRREVREAVDRILDKINTQGFAALSVREIQVLDDAKFFFKKPDKISNKNES